MSEAQWTAHEAVQRLTSGDIGSVELIDALITRIESEDERVNAYVHLDADAARAFLQLISAEAAASGATLVFVSHDRSLAGMFDRTVELPKINQPAGALGS